jgi:hypothetical protein
VTRLALALLAPALLAMTCWDERTQQATAAAGGPGSEAVQGLTPEQSAAARRTIAAWLECEECTDGELEAVKRLGATAVPTLVATLGAGPSPAARELVRRELRAHYAELEAAARARGRPLPPGDVEAWVEQEIAAWVARYQVRSAQALDAIGGPEAERALRAAQASGALREDVADALRKLLDDPS